MATGALTVTVTSSEVWAAVYVKVCVAVMRIFIILSTRKCTNEFNGALYVKANEFTPAVGVETVNCDKVKTVEEASIFIPP
jgi:hypothetical protein